MNKVYISYVAAADGAEVLRIEGDGRLFWRGREVETDSDFVKAMLELRDALMPVSTGDGPV